MTPLENCWFSFQAKYILESIKTFRLSANLAFEISSGILKAEFDAFFCDYVIIRFLQQIETMLS